MENILLIDGSNLLYRAYYATESREMISPQGMDVNAIYTVISMIKKYIEEYQPTYVFVALDEGKDTFRHQAYEDYKGTRPQTPDRLKKQFELARELYNCMGIKACGHPEYEADDLIATLAKLANEKGIEAQVISSDKDLLQIINEQTKVFVPKTNTFGKDINYTQEIFKDKYEVDVSEWVLYKSLVGDTSDNIIGINKIGPKTAVKLINEYHNAESIINAAKNDELKPAQNKNITQGADNLLTNLSLVKLVDDINLDFDLDDLIWHGFTNKDLLVFLEKHGMNRHFSTFQKLMKVEKQAISCAYQEIEEFSDKYIGKLNYIFTKTLESNYFLSTPLGFGIYNELGLFYLSQDKVNESFINFIKDDSEKVTFDLKQLMAILKLKEVGNFLYDLKIAYSLLDSDNYKRDLGFICLEYNVKGVYNYTELYGSKSNPTLDWDNAKVDVCSSAKALADLSLPILNKLEVSNLANVYYNIEHPLIKVLAKMEIEGLDIDLDKMESLKQQYSSLIDEVSDEISKITDINVNSSKQLSDFLFNQLQINPKGIKKTTNGYSTDQETLNYLLTVLDEDDIAYEFINLLLKHRSLSKIYKTYLLGIEKFIIDGKIHPIYHQLLTETGRLSSSDPNIQNIPVRSEEGKEIRGLFPAPKGYNFVTCDYSQVELRVIAQLSGEEHMIDDFKHGLDIHAQTAKKVFGKDEITPLDRSKAKAINFGIIYGISPFGLSSQIGSSISEASEFITTYLDTYPNIKKYQDKVVKDGLNNGYIKTYFDRIRYIKTDYKKSSELEAIKRICINTPIQGTAADIIKMAMIKVDEYLTTNNIDAKMVIQIHDELVFYIKEDISKQVVSDILDIMQNIVDFDVKLEVDSTITSNWKDAK